VTDFSARIISGLAATQPNREALARNCMGEFDRNGDSAISAGEFLRVFAGLQRTEESAASHGSSWVSAGIRPTLFDCTLFPSYSTTYAKSAYQANAMLATYDADDSGSVTQAELLYVQPTTPPAPTPAQRADEMLALYDKGNKGYIDIADVISAWINNPALSDGSDPTEMIAAWDRDGDEMVTRDELISDYQIMDTADALVSTFGNATTGSINLASVTDEQLSMTDITRDDLQKWDADTNGELTRAEIVTALRIPIAQPLTDPAAIAAGLMKLYDADQSSSLDADEFAALQNRSGGSMADASTFASWDANGDAVITQSELQNGLQIIQDARDTIAKYDGDAKGYFTLADLQQVIDADPAAATASAQDLMTWWDVNGDGQVTPQDIIARNELTRQQQADATSAAGDVSATEVQSG
jgi:Ca2+-binding EF-hand superfamily protein